MSLHEHLCGCHMVQRTDRRHSGGIIWLAGVYERLGCRRGRRRTLGSTRLYVLPGFSKSRRGGEALPSSLSGATGARCNLGGVAIVDFPQDWRIFAGGHGPDGSASVCATYSHAPRVSCWMDVHDVAFASVKSGNLRVAHASANADAHKLLTERRRRL